MNDAETFRETMGKEQESSKASASFREQYQGADPSKGGVGSVDRHSNLRNSVETCSLHWQTEQGRATKTISMWETRSNQARNIIHYTMTSANLYICLDLCLIIHESIVKPFLPAV